MIFDFLTSIFFPHTCAACRAFVRTGALCDRCRATIALSRTLFCGQCDAALAPHPGPAGCGASTDAIPKSACHPMHPFLLGAAGNYETPALRALVHRLKFRGIAGAAEPLATLLITYAKPFMECFRGAAVIPIPLSAARLRSRGFNQSALIAERFAAPFGLMVTGTCLVRTRHAKPQSETKTLAEREANIRGCFAVRGAERIRGATIILIDDVTTSGATFLEAARALKQAGAGSILAVAAAKTHRGTIPSWHRSP